MGRSFFLTYTAIRFACLAFALGCAIVAGGAVVVVLKARADEDSTATAALGVIADSLRFILLAAGVGLLADIAEKMERAS